MTLTEFVLARVAEREAVARAAADVAASPWQWQHLPPPLDYGLVGMHPIQGGVTVIIPSRFGDMWPDRDTADHIALNDPAAVLARCAVDRQIVALHRLYDDRPYRETPCCQRCTAGGEYPADDAWTDEQNWPCPTLRALASLDAGHPDYDESWRP